MKIPHLYTGADNESHFGEIDIELRDIGNSASSVSDPLKSTGIIFRNTTGDYHLDWHTAPRRQYVIILEGQVEIEIGDGTKRRFGPGEMFLAEDTTGHGHISRAVDNQPRKSVFVFLD